MIKNTHTKEKKCLMPFTFILRSFFKNNEEKWMINLNKEDNCHITDCLDCDKNISISSDKLNLQIHSP